MPMDLERFYLLAFSGMRSGELCALKWTDIYFESNQIRITKTLYNENNNMKEYVLVTPKTKGSIRTVDIDESVMNLLKTYKDPQQKVMIENKENNPEFHDANLYFVGITDTHLFRKPY
ncbi:site-specific integrase [Paenibacillus solani]|uniref:site-specific integrase n=1 Tax=Paenibacillus solani TaxID=1705565 RepID=UPI003D2E3A95